MVNDKLAFPEHGPDAISSASVYLGKIGQGEGSAMASMGRLVSAALAGVLLLAGCNSANMAGLFALRSDASGRDRVLAGSLETVAKSAEGSLTELGFVVATTRQGDTIRIASKTAAGAKFTLVLTRQMTKDGEQTRARIEWDGAGDDQAGFQILGKLETLSTK
jgi:hypothetical protein